MNSKIWITIIVLFVISSLAIFNSPFSSGEVGRTNYVINPSTDSSGAITPQFSATVGIKVSLSTSTT